MKQNAELFNSFFSKKCFFINNSSKLRTNLKYATDKHLYTITFKIEGSSNIIQNLDQNKAHGHDNVIIHILKIYKDTKKGNIQTTSTDY